MTIKPLLYGRIEKGMITWISPGIIRLYFSGLEGREVQVTVEKRKKQASLKQLRYYRGVIIPILSEELGYFPDEINEILKWKFLRYETKDGFETVKSWKNMNTAEREEFYSNVRIWAAADLNIYIPLPGECSLD